MTSAKRVPSALLPDAAEDQLERAIKAHFEGRDLDIYRMMAWQLGHEDRDGSPSPEAVERRLHGSLLLATAQALHGDYTIGVKYAVSVELMHNFALIHGDVQDGNTERMGRASVWWKWGPSQAINTGDGMHAMARLSLFDLCDEGEPLARVGAALEIVDDAVLNRCEGEFLDVAFQERTSVTVVDYLDMVARRVGSLYGASAELASILQDDFSTQRREALRRFGENIGVVKQLAADYQAIFSGDERDPIQQGRIISKKKSIPLAHLFDTVKDPSILRRAGEMFMQRVIDPSRIAELTAMVADAGGREFTLGQIATHLSNAEAALLETGIDAEATAGLISLAHEIGDVDRIADLDVSHA
jgi:geranylgeranyl diphosphate synthase type I